MVSFPLTPCTWGVCKNIYLLINGTSTAEAPVKQLMTVQVALEAKRSKRRHLVLNRHRTCPPADERRDNRSKIEKSTERRDQQQAPWRLPGPRLPLAVARLMPHKQAAVSGQRGGVCTVGNQKAGPFNQHRLRGGSATHLPTANISFNHMITSIPKCVCTYVRV